MERVGLIGLGTMGYPIAKNLLDAGYSLLIYDIDTMAKKDLCDKAATFSSLKEIGNKSEIIILVLPNGDTVNDVLFRNNGIVSNISPGTLVIDMSSITPVESKLFEKKLNEHGVGFIDAPMSGGEEGAIEGTLAIMVGGSKKNFDRAKKIFNILGSTAVLVGDVGSGSIAKLANQIIVNLNIAAVSEAFVFVKKAGADPEKVFEAIRNGLAGSNVLDSKVPRMINRNFKPGGKIGINHKDINNAIQTADKFDVPLLMTTLLFGIMQTLKANGNLNEDHSAILRFFEKLAGIEIS